MIRNLMPAASMPQRPVPHRQAPDPQTRRDGAPR
jgi:hypothetical protein